MMRLWRWLGDLVRRRHLDRESAEELQLHVELLVESKRVAGIDEAEARRQVRFELGSVEATREQLAESRGGYHVEQTLRELLYACRVLRRARGFTVLAVATLGTGIGASAVLFTLVSAIVLRPLPYPDADRLVRVFDTNPSQGVDRTGVASGNINDWRSRSTRFDGIAGYYVIGRTISSAADAEVILTAQVSRDFFPLLGVAPAMGRTFTDGEIRRAVFDSAAAPVGPDPVAVIAHSLWRQRFGARPDVIGETFVLERQPFRIVGVMPPDFVMPEPGVQLWLPWGLSVDQPRDQHYLSAVARLARGTTLDEASADLNRVAGELAREFPATNRGWGIRLGTLHAETVGPLASVLWILLAAVGLLLLIACASVALLSTMRGLDRSDEIAMRLALGASRGRVVRELLMESGFVATLGGLAGGFIAAAAVRLLPWIAADLPRLDEIRLEGVTFLFIATVSTVVAVVCGLAPALRAARGGSFVDIAGGAMRSTTRIDRYGTRSAIVIGQVALAMVLVAGSGLLVRTVEQLRSIDSGFDAQGVVVLPIFLDTKAYNTGIRIRAYYDSLFERLRALPGVVAVGGATSLPASPLGPDFDRPVWPEEAADDPVRRTPAAVRIATPDYFDALKLRVTDGRRIEATDRPDTSRVVMVSETLARRLWPVGRAVGRRLVVDYSTAGTYPYEVIGVVKDVRFRGPRSEPRPEIYLAHAQRSYLILNVAVRAIGDPRSIMMPIRQVLHELDPQKPAHGLYRLDDLLGATIVRERQTMTTLVLFAAAAVFLAVLGAYGVLSQRVRERSREIGIRMAMGADRVQVIGWVAQGGMRMIAIGMAIGLGVAALLSQRLSGLLYGVQPTDPLTGVLAIGLLTVVGLVASLIPSWRASQIDPVVVLRQS